MTEAQIDDLDRYEQSNAYDDLQKAVIRFAEQWTRQSKVDFALMQRLGGSLTPAQFVTLAATVALANWTNRFNESFGTELP